MTGTFTCVMAKRQRRASAYRRPVCRAIVMPNLKPPVTMVEQAADYRQRILPHCRR